MRRSKCWSRRETGQAQSRDHVDGAVWASEQPAQEVMQSDLGEDEGGRGGDHPGEGREEATEPCWQQETAVAVMKRWLKMLTVL